MLKKLFITAAAAAAVSVPLAGAAWADKPATQLPNQGVPENDTAAVVNLHTAVEAQWSTADPGI